MKTKEEMMNRLRGILDPELGINIVDMGLIYGLEIMKSGKVSVTMTLTTLGCPLAGFLEEQIREALMGLEGVIEVEVELTFDPPWNQEMMTDEAKQQLGLD